MTRRRLVLAALLVTFTSIPAGAAIQLRLWVEPQSQLPAIEPSLRVEAINTGDEPATLPSIVALQVVPPEPRKPFVAFTGLRGEDRVAWFYTGEERRSIVLAPKATSDLSFWAGPESPVWFAADSRLLVPGTYRFQLVVHEKLDSNLLAKVELAVDQRGLTEPIVSNEATYVVETPQGEDAVVWEMIKQLQTPTFWSDALGSRIWAEHPQSRYTAYCLNDKSTDPDVSIAAYTAALEKQPSRPWAERYRLNMARDEISRSEDFISARDVDGAFETRKRAHTILTELAKNGLDPALRRKAEELLHSYSWTRADIEYHIRDLKGELTETRPYAICVEKTGNGKHIFWFGYDNTTLEPMTIPIGPDNKFTPPPFDRGQPTVFPAHETVLGVRIETTEPAVMWHLQHYNVQASLAKTQPCPANLHELHTYEPPQRQ